MATYFIGDLHLALPDGSGGAADQLLTQFEQFCRACDSDAEALYILGDLFDAWIGDDAGVTAYQPVVTALSQLSVPVFLLHGNRDFLIDQPFCDASGVQLLSDPITITCGGETVVICHGDQLCTDDQDYQQMRTVTRHPQWRNEFLQQSIDQRIKQAASYRKISQESTQEKSAIIMDANDAAVVEVLEQHRCLTMIHGHTHRPARHSHPTRQGTATRWVVGSWQQGAEILRWDDSGASLIPLTEYLQ